MSEDLFVLKKAPAGSPKKWSVRVPTATGGVKTVLFGARGYEDFTIHKDKARRDDYRSRHQHDHIDDPLKAGFWSWHALWGDSSDLKKAFAAAVRLAKKYMKRKNPNPPGTPSPTLAEAAEVVAVLDVPKNLRAEFLKGLATEWEHAHTVDYDLIVVGNIVLDHLAEDPHYYRKLRRARLNPAADSGVADRVQSCFDALLAIVQEQYPSLRCTIEVDERAGERDGHACARAYAFCEDLADGAFRIAVAHKMNDPSTTDDSRVEGLLCHELAHAVLLHTGDLEHTERDADDVAEALFGSPLFYDEEDVQTTDQSAPGARRPRPAYLDDENGRTLDSAFPEREDARTNPDGHMRLETVADVVSCLDDCAAQGDAKTPRMLASKFSQQAGDVEAPAQARMLRALAKASRHCANAIEARMSGAVDRAMACERLCDRALDEARSPERRNPEWAKKLGSGLYKGARYAGETARDLYHGAREAHRARMPVEGERKNPRRRATFGDEYKYFIVDMNGEPESGWEYREDAKDALRDGSSGRPGLRIVGRSSVDEQKLADFIERHRNNPRRRVPRSRY